MAGEITASMSGIQAPRQPGTTAGDIAGLIANFMKGQAEERRYQEDLALEQAKVAASQMNAEASMAQSEAQKAIARTSQRSLDEEMRVTGRNERLYRESIPTWRQALVGFEMGGRTLSRNDLDVMRPAEVKAAYDHMMAILEQRSRQSGSGTAAMMNNAQQMRSDLLDRMSQIETDIRMRQKQFDDAVLDLMERSTPGLFAPDPTGRIDEATGKPAMILKPVSSDPVLAQVAEEARAQAVATLMQTEWGAHAEETSRRQEELTRYGIEERMYGQHIAGYLGMDMGQMAEIYNSVDDPSQRGMSSLVVTGLRGRYDPSLPGTPLDKIDISTPQGQVELGIELGKGLDRLIIGEGTYEVPLQAMQLLKQVPGGEQVIQTFLTSRNFESEDHFRQLAGAANEVLVQSRQPGQPQVPVISSTGPSGFSQTKPAPEKEILESRNEAADTSSLNTARSIARNAPKDFTYSTVRQLLKVWDTYRRYGQGDRRAFIDAVAEHSKALAEVLEQKTQNRL